MQLLSTASSFKRHLARLIQSYPNIAFGVAWASASTKPFELLMKHKDKVKVGVIGTHFYQTHPDVLDCFVESKKVKFALQPKGVFHPKLYVFWGQGRWEAIVGSANFTAGAMGENTELSTLLTHEDGEHLQELLQLIEGYSVEAKVITADEAENYRRIWKAKQPVLRKLVDQYGDYDSTKPAVYSHVMGMDWPLFLAEIQQQDKTHGFDERLDLLAKVQQAFADYDTFNDIPLDLRLGIAGLRSKTLKHSLWFGSMVGAGKFYSRVNAGDPALSFALSEIPANGTVTKEQYRSFIVHYLKAFPEGRDGIATATRLLCMKRPDQFLCVDSKNRRKLAKDVGMTNPTQLDYERYWDEVVERLMDSPWWKSPPPKHGKALQAWNARAAMLDAIFFEASK